MHFHHELVTPLRLSRSEDTGIRLYQTPSGKKYPSVTTVLGTVLPKSAGLEEWAARVGPEEANRNMQRSATRGTALHRMCELYLLNDPDYAKGVMPSILALFKMIKPVLDKRVTTVYGLEIPMYSDYIRVAGTCDLIALFDGVASIIDYKTSNWQKEESMMENYFLQESLYSAMFSELYGRPIEQLVTISVGESEHEPHVVIKKRDDYLPRAIKLVRQYHNL